MYSPRAAMPPASKKASTSKRKAPAAPAPAAAPDKRTRPHRTPQTPFEQTEETLYNVDKITNMRFSKGVRENLVRWEGYAAAHDTWEPIENLVGCAQQIREYEQQREAAQARLAQAQVGKWAASTDTRDKQEEVHVSSC